MRRAHRQGSGSSGCEYAAFFLPRRAAACEHTLAHEKQGTKARCNAGRAQAGRREQRLRVRGVLPAAAHGRVRARPGM